MLSVYSKPELKQLTDLRGKVLGVTLPGSTTDLTALAKQSSLVLDLHEAQPEYPVINMMEEQKKVIDKGATMRLGVYPCQLRPGTRARLHLSPQRRPQA